eukprot:scpid69995/ scgid28957/ 
MQMCMSSCTCASLQVGELLRWGHYCFHTLPFHTIIQHYFQTLHVLSLETVARYCPDGLNVQARISAVCPASTLTALPPTLRGFHRRPCVSLLQLAITVPELLKSHPVT